MDNTGDHMAKSIGRPVVNKHKVPTRQWTKWSNHARKVFNNVYQSMRPTMQFAYTHPMAAPVPKKHWDTTRWNAAWTAADSADGMGVLRRVIEVDA